MISFGSTADHKIGASGLLAVCGAIATLICLYAADWWPEPDSRGRGFLDSAQQVTSLRAPDAGSAPQRAFLDWGHYLLATSVALTTIAVLTGRHRAAVVGAVTSVAGIGWMEWALALPGFGGTDWTRYLAGIGVGMLTVAVVARIAGDRDVIRSRSGRRA
ncbi:MAG: hypothetical protein WAV90_11985 [Gordonia amarae]